MTDRKTYKLALGGICLALTLIFLFGASIVPGAELTLYAISSLFVAVMIIETGVKGGIGLYGAAVLLGFLVIPNKIGMFPYACLFGIYGIVKFYIEKIRKPAGQLILKILFFAAVLLAGFGLFKELLLGAIQLPDLPVPVLTAAGILFLLLYDVLYTLLIRIYRQRVRRSEQEPIQFKLSKETIKKDHE